jgi:glycosyltransferase involved in cell wall biosynthesis
LRLFIKKKRSLQFLQILDQLTLSQEKKDVLAILTSQHEFLNKFIVSFDNFINEIEIKSNLNIHAECDLYSVHSGYHTLLRVTYMESFKFKCEYYDKRDHIISIETLREIYPFLLIYANNKISFNKMYLYYNAVDCTILTSFCEGWPNVIKESIFCDTPVVSTDVSDLGLLALKSKYIQISELSVEEFCKKIFFVINLTRPKNLKKLINFCYLNYYLKQIKSLYNNLT